MLRNMLLTLSVGARGAIRSASWPWSRCGLQQKRLGIADNGRGSDNSHGQARPLLPIVISVIALLLYPATAAEADTRYCGRPSELPTARVRWEAARLSPADPALREKNCRAYGSQFYEVATVRQAVSTCRDGLDHRLDLEVLDFEIDAFNKLIATQCGE